MKTTACPNKPARWWGLLPAARAPRSGLHRIARRQPAVGDAVVGHYVAVRRDGLCPGRSGASRPQYEGPACVTPDDQTLASRATCRCTGPTPAGSSAPKHLLLKVWRRRPAQAIGESRTSGSRPRRVLPPALAARCQMVLVGAHTLPTSSSVVPMLERGDSTAEPSRRWRSLARRQS